MNQSPSDPLSQAAEYIRAGQTQLAQSVLARFIRQHPDSVQGWYLLSFVANEPDQQIDCLRRALRVNPHNTQARLRLQQIQSPDATSRLGTSSAVWSSAVQAVRRTDVEPQVNEPAAAPPPRPDLAHPAIESSAPTKPADSEWMSRFQQASARATSYESGSEPEPKPEPGTTSAHASRLTGEPLRKTRRRAIPVWLAVVILVAFAVLVFGGVALVYFGARNQPEQNPPAGQVAAVAPTSTPAPTRPLPPTYTPTTFPPTWTPTPIPTPLPTRTPTPFPTVNATIGAGMDLIEHQVSDLRGLSIEGDVPSLVIDQYSVEQTLKSLLVEQGYLEKLPDQGRVLSALGLIKPTYDLVKYALNGLADNIGGFYLPWMKRVFVIGNRFGGVEHYIFSHEYDHALVDQHFHIDELGVYPDCLGDAQRCEAIQALVEGDATLLMAQWWQQYAGPRDYQDILRYHPPAQTVPDQFPPPYVIQDLTFPYEAGLTFVQYLYARGNWANVNKAYVNLPQSTEQILHPEKYVAGEQPIDVPAPPLDAVLSADWRLLDSNVLGEWTTYLILAYGADVAAQVDNATALAASRGWGGDHYQVYYNDVTTQTLLAVEWVWDTPRDANEFKQAMLSYQDERFRGAKSNRSEGECWAVNNQISCVFATGQKTLWLLAPDQAILDKVLAAYRDFTHG